MSTQENAPALALAWTILHVPDVAGTVAFYERAFGLERRFIAPDGDYAELATGTTTLAFAAHALVHRLTDGAVPLDGGPPRGLDLALTTPAEHIEAAWRRALDAGATPVKPLGTMPWGQTVGFVRDPNGFLIEICTPVDAPG